MCPIHETDRAQERWSRDEWKYLELWEKLEQRLKKFKRYWIYATVVLFLILSSIPVVIERLPHWKALKLSRSLAEEVAQLKLLASTTRKAHRLRFLDQSLLVFQIESAASCESTEAEFVPIRAGALTSENEKNKVVLLNSEQAQQNQIPGVLTSICYDPVAGAQGLSQNEDLAGFALIPVKDLTEMRMDRIAILLLKGPSAEISFN